MNRSLIRTCLISKRCLNTNNADDDDRLRDPDRQAGMAAAALQRRFQGGLGTNGRAGVTSERLHQNSSSPIRARGLDSASRSVLFCNRLIKPLGSRRVWGAGKRSLAVEPGAAWSARPAGRRRGSDSDVGVSEKWWLTWTKEASLLPQRRPLLRERNPTLPPDVLRNPAAICWASSGGLGWPLTSPRSSLLYLFSISGRRRAALHLPPAPRIIIQRLPQIADDLLLV